MCKDKDNKRTIKLNKFFVRFKYTHRNEVIPLRNETWVTLKPKRYEPPKWKIIY